MRCSGCARPEARRCIWAMRWRRGSTPRCWSKTSRSCSAPVVEDLLFDGDAVRGVRDRTVHRAPRVDRARARAWCWRPGGFSHMMQAFAERFFPAAAGVCLRRRAWRNAETACVSRWRAAPGRAPRVADPAYLGARVTASAGGRQPGRFPAYRDGPGEARHHRGQCVGKAFRQRSAVVPRVRARHAGRRQRRRRAVRSILSATAGFSGPMGLAASSRLPGASRRYVRSGESDRGANTRRAGRI